MLAPEFNWHKKYLLSSIIKYMRMLNRRKFVQVSGLLGLVLPSKLFAETTEKLGNKPVVISTWVPNLKANRAAWRTLQKGGYALQRNFTIAVTHHEFE